MSADYLVADLTSFQPTWRTGEGKGGRIHCSFCLPWFRGESPLVGEAAKCHRRGTNLHGIHPETCFNPENPSRRHWAEGWLVLGSRPDSLLLTRDRFEWHPPGESGVVGVNFSRVVRRALEGLGQGSLRLGLVVPAGLGPGPREQLLSELEKVFAEVQFFPRTVAVALDWCESQAGKELLARTTAEPGERAGSLLVMTGGADVWEIALVPLRLEETNENRLLCPVQDRTQVPAETLIWGLPWQASHLSASDREATEDAFLQMLLGSHERSASKPSRKAYSIISKHLRECLPCTPVEAAFAPGSSFWKKFVQSVQDLDSSGELHAVVLSGPWGSQDELPRWMREPGQNVSTPPVLSGLEAPLRGADEGMRRLTEKVVPYYEALASLQLLYLDRNRFYDPEQRWLNLLEEAEVPAGKEYKSPKPIRDFFLSPAKEPKITLTIRREKRGEDILWSLSAKGRKALERREDVWISARVRPGHGSACVEVHSESRGLFDAMVREDRMEAIEHLPPLQYGWPPGSAYVVSHHSMSGLALPTLEKVLIAARRNRLTSLILKNARENELNKWQRPQDLDVYPEDLDYPDEIHSLFVYLGVIPSARVKAEPKVEPILQQLIELLPIAFDTRPQLRTDILWFASWFYARCPEPILDYVRARLRDDRSKVKGEVLACAGNCFTKEEDFSLFFNRLHHAAVSDDLAPTYWLRAYRNLARFRHESLMREVLPGDTQHTIMKWYLREFGKALSNPSPSSQLFLQCCYLAPHILKRRRFEENFLAPDSDQAMRFEKILKEASDLARSRKHRANAECALDFLHKQATDKTLEKLRESEQA